MTFLWNGRARCGACCVLWVLTRREVASRHTGTALGIVWPYLQPLLTVAAYYLVFDVVFGMPLGSRPYAGRWRLPGGRCLALDGVLRAVQRGMTSLIDAGSLLHKTLAAR